MGCAINSAKPQELSLSLRKKASEIFKKIDTKGSGIIDKEGTQEFWKSNFAKINTEALFDAVDFDKSGGITEDEWMAFWEIVKQCGYTEEEINEEMDELLEGKAWVKFKRVDRFVNGDLKRRNSQVKSIVLEEKKKLTLLKQKTLQSQENERIQGSPKNQQV